MIEQPAKYLIYLLPIGADDETPKYWAFAASIQEVVNLIKNGVKVSEREGRLEEVTMSFERNKGAKDVLDCEVSHRFQALSLIGWYRIIGL